MSRLLLAQALRSALQDAAIGAALVTLLAMLPGLAAALSFRRTGKPARYAAAGLALLLLIAPAPPFSAAAFLHDPSNRDTALALAAAVARSAALIMLVLLAGLRAVPPGLQRAAMLAGARPFQAWRHAVLAPLGRYLVAAFAASFALVLATGPLLATLAPHWAIANLWAVPACLLLAIAGIAGIATLLPTSREA